MGFLKILVFLSADSQRARTRLSCAATSGPPSSRQTRRLKTGEVMVVAVVILMNPAPLATTG